MAVVLAKGQLSYLILSCLEEKDMYGLELIDEIKKRSGVEIKLPSLYSNINRMKELKFISSYLKESTKGPKCAYSSITEAGRNELARLKETFKGAEAQPKEEKAEEFKEIENEEKDIKSNYDDYDDFFAEIPEEDKQTSASDEVPAISPVQEEETNCEEESISEEKIKEPVLIEEKIEEVIESPKVENEEIEEQKELVVHQETLQLGDAPVEKPKNDAVFLPKNESNSYSDEYNRKLFDVSKDYNKYKKRKSFSENQIEMVVNATDPVELQREREKKTENINVLKEALLQTRQGKYEEVKLDLLNRQEARKQPEEAYEEVQKESEKLVDDGKFITDRVEYNSANNRRFEPSKFSFLNTQQETILPAPKRNTNLDPNCSDVKARLESLYMKTQIEKPVEESKVESKSLNEDFENFDDLKDYYEGQNISFKIFKRTGKRTLHNTNKINFIVDSIIFGVISLCCGLFYLLFSKLGITNANTDFIYYLCPILYFIYLMVRLYMYKKCVSKVPRPLFNFIVVIGGALLVSVVIFCLNLAFGMSINNIPACSTTLFVPIVMVLIIFIVRHYTLLFAYKKFWR